MKNFQVIIIFFLFFIAGKSVYADWIAEYDGLYSITLGGHTTDTIDPYIGLMGYFGFIWDFDDTDEMGMGIMVSREKGRARVQGVNFDALINFD